MPASRTLPATIPEKARRRVERQVVTRLIAVQLERAHRRVRRLERLLKIEADMSVPN